MGTSMWMADVATSEYYIDGAPSPSDFGFLGAGGSTGSSETLGGISSLTIVQWLDLLKDHCPWGDGS